MHYAQDHDAPCPEDVNDGREYIHQLQLAAHEYLVAQEQLENARRSVGHRRELFTRLLSHRPFGAPDLVLGHPTVESQAILVGWDGEQEAHFARIVDLPDLGP